MVTSKGAKSKEIIQGTERVITGGDRLTIETIGDFARKIQQTIMETEKIIVDLAETVEVDITALQLFCSACRTADAAGKQFMYRGTVPQALLDLAAAAGSERQEHCKYNNISCFRKFGGMV